MKQTFDDWNELTTGRGAVALTEHVRAVLQGSAIRDGLATVFVHHTSALLFLCENADPVVLADSERWLARVAPDGDVAFQHAAEGPDDRPAHARSVLTGNSLSIPVRAGALELGTWQGVFHPLRRPHRATPEPFFVSDGDPPRGCTRRKSG